MEFESANPQVVKSIKQRDLLNTWLRLYAREQLLPRVEEYQPERLTEELSDLVFHTVDTASTPPRLTIQSDGTRISNAYGHTGKGRYLDEYLGPRLAPIVMPVYYTCIARRLPVYTIAHIDDINRQQRLPGLGARQGQEAVNEAGESIGFLEHAANDAAIGELVAPPAQPHLSNASNRGERCPHLMRDVRGEASHLIKRPLEPTQRFIEHRCEPPQLVVRIVDRKSVAQPIGRDRMRAFRHAVDRRQGASGE